jgi:hypothetical protein
MKPVLVLEHQLPERLAYLGTWLTKQNIVTKHQQTADSIYKHWFSSTEWFN